jgi:hypothetical protein
LIELAIDSFYLELILTLNLAFALHIKALLCKIFKSLHFIIKI